MKNTDEADGRNGFGRVAGAGVLVTLCALWIAAGPNVKVPGEEGRLKSSATDRAERRLFEGAPPVIGHADFKTDCMRCHTMLGIEVPGVGFAPPMPHAETMGLSGTSNCKQCHAYKTTDETFVENDFVGVRQDLRKGKRLNSIAPAVMPHSPFMRENCVACHSGPAAREEIRTSHPDRLNCRQCHAQSVVTTVFER